MIDLSFLKAKPKITKLPPGVDYLKLYYALKYSFNASYMFESLVLPKQQDRYYTIGFDPLYIFSARGNRLKITGKDTDEEITTDNLYSELKKYLPKIPTANRYQGGLIGYFSYEAANYFEPSLDLEEHPDFPLFEMGLYVDGVVYDRETEELAYYTFGENRSKTVLNVIGQLQGVEPPDAVDSVTDRGLSVGKDKFKDTVEDTLVEIRKGNSFQVEVGFREDYEIKGDKFAIYNRLRTVNPSPYMYYVHFGERELFGSSPELVVSAIDGKILTTPAAGTVRRGLDDKEDKKLARQLLNDPKERAEHAMLVDLHRNDISKVSKYGSVKVEDLMHLIKFKFVQHMYSDVVGEMRPDRDSFDLLAGIMPCGVLTGAPKIETMKIISRNEDRPRGPYGGAIGRFSFNGDCAFALPIRGLFCAGDYCFSQACAGIVFDSDPEKEYDEVVAKLAGMRKTIKDVGE
jgi:anthranilate synthase component 1